MTVTSFVVEKHRLRGAVSDQHLLTGAQENDGRASDESREGSMPARFDTGTGEGSPEPVVVYSFDAL